MSGRRNNSLHGHAVQFFVFFYFLWVGGGGGGGRLKMATITREVKQEQPDENSANGKSSHVFPNADRQ